jgi:Kdo2-lipid IVA lauroyltransferase/acyltransferase
MVLRPPGDDIAARDPGADSGPVSLARFLAPRYWPTWLLLGWMRVLAVLPFGTMVALQRAIARVLARLTRSRQGVPRRNLELCFPQLGEREIEALLTRHLEALAICVGEMSFAWFASPRRMRALFHVQGMEHLEAALARGKGVILYTAHFTPFEICAPVLKRLLPRYAFMYSRRRNALLQEVQRRKRLRTGHESFARDNVRAMLRSLERNAAVWYAPDLAYHGRSSTLIPFFGEPAMTNIATGKLARLSGAAVVPFAYRRSADDSGYVLTFHAPLDDFPTDDPIADTRRLVAILEEFIRACPEQYLWTHHRFGGRPAPLPDPYGERAS